MFAVDAGSTMAVGKAMEKYGLAAKGVHAGGFDLLPSTLDAIAKGDLDFTIDQQPYLQGFYTVMEMAMFKFSGGLTGPAEINTGLKFVTKGNVEPYRATQSRYEGNSSAEKVVARSGPITRLTKGACDAGRNEAGRRRRRPATRPSTASSCCAGRANRAALARGEHPARRVLLAAYFQSTNSTFLSVSNIKNLIDFTATTAIIAAGEVMVLVCGELDLSVGMVYALVPFLMHFLIVDGVPAGAAMVLALAAAGMIGLVNGAITTFLSVPAFVTTLGTMFLINGLTLTISGGFPVQPQAAPSSPRLSAARLGEARLGAGHRDRLAVRAEPDPFRTAHHRHRRQSRRRRGGRHQSDQHQDRQFRAVQHARRLCRSHRRLPHRLDRSARGRIRDHVHGHRLGGDRRHAFHRRLGNRHRRAGRRAGAGDPPGRFFAQRGQRLHFRHDPRRRDPFDHGGQCPADPWRDRGGG